MQCEVRVFRQMGRASQCRKHAFTTVTDEAGALRHVCRGHVWTTVRNTSLFEFIEPIGEGFALAVTCNGGR